MSTLFSKTDFMEMMSEWDDEQKKLWTNSMGLTPYQLHRYLRDFDDVNGYCVARRCRVADYYQYIDNRYPQQTWTQYWGIH